MGPITFQKSVSISLEIFLLISADSAGENTGSETRADSTDQNQEVDSSDSVEEENVNTDDTNTANEASEEDNKEELNDNSTGDNTSDQNSGVDNTETEDESNAKTKLENMKTGKKTFHLILFFMEFFESLGSPWLQ